MSRTVVAAALAVAGCQSVRGDVSDAVGTGKVVALVGLEGRWAGPVVPDAANCGAPSTGTMTIGDGGFGFDPFQSTTVVSGRVERGGTLSGTLERTGGGGKLLRVTFEAHVNPASAGRWIDGTLVSGRCRWKVALERG